MTYKHLAKTTVSEEVLNEAVRRQRAITGFKGSFDDLSRAPIHRLWIGTPTGVIGDDTRASRLTIVVVNSQAWSAIISRVWQMLLPDPDDPDYVYAPTATALTQMLSLLGPAIQKLRYVLPRPLLSPDGSGGIRFEWHVGNKQLRLVFRADASPYIYHQIGDEYDIEESPNQDRTALWLDWLSA